MSLFSGSDPDKDPITLTYGGNPMVNAPRSNKKDARRGARRRLRRKATRAKAQRARPVRNSFSAVPNQLQRGAAFKSTMSVIFSRRGNGAVDRPPLLEVMNALGVSGSVRAKVKAATAVFAAIGPLKRAKVPAPRAARPKRPKGRPGSAKSSPTKNRRGSAEGDGSKVQPSGGENRHVVPRLPHDPLAGLIGTEWKPGAAERIAALSAAPFPTTQPVVDTSHVNRRPPKRQPGAKRSPGQRHRNKKSVAARISRNFSIWDNPEGSVQYPGHVPWHSPIYDFGLLEDDDFADVRPAMVAAHIEAHAPKNVDFDRISAAIRDGPDAINRIWPYSERLARSKTGLENPYQELLPVLGKISTVLKRLSETRR
jgi:hypothetical protein